MHGKTNLKYSECVPILVLVIQHAKRTHRTLLSVAACWAVPWFSTIYHNVKDFREKIIELENVL